MGPGVELVEVVALRSDVDRVADGRQREYGGLGYRGDTFIQRTVRFDEGAGAGIDDADSARGSEPDPAFGVAAAAQEFHGVGQRQRVADVQTAVVFEHGTSVYPPHKKPFRSASSTVAACRGVSRLARNRWSEASKSAIPADPEQTT